MAKYKRTKEEQVIPATVEDVEITGVSINFARSEIRVKAVGGHGDSVIVTESSPNQLKKIIEDIESIAEEILGVDPSTKS